LKPNEKPIFTEKDFACKYGVFMTFATLSRYAKVRRIVNFMTQKDTTI